MNILEKLALPTLDDKLVEEINRCKVCFENIDMLDEEKFSKIQKKKELLQTTFEILGSIFNLGYDDKLRFNSSKTHAYDKGVYIDNINTNNYDSIFYEMFFQCFSIYLDNSYALKNNRIDDQMYSMIRLASLNNDDIVIKKLANKVYSEIIDSRCDIDYLVVAQEIDPSDIIRIANNNALRIANIKHNIKEYSLDGELSAKEIRDLYSCFSNNIFNGLSVEEKVLITSLLHGYFSSDLTNDKIKKYKRVINDKTTNKECIRMVINELIVPGRTMIIKKKNLDLVNNILSGLPTIYKNELRKQDVSKLDDLYKIVNNIRK